MCGCSRSPSAVACLSAHTTVSVYLFFVVIVDHPDASFPIVLCSIRHFTHSSFLTDN
jgi:hypothetical protein